MFNWLKRFIKWPDKGINNIGDLGNYVKKNWFGLLIFLLLVVVGIWLLLKITKLLMRLIIVGILILGGIFLVIWVIRLIRK